MNRWWAAPVAAMVILVFVLSACSSDDSGSDEKFDPTAAQVLAFDIHSSVEGTSADWAPVMELFADDLDDGNGKVHERAVGIFLTRVSSADSGDPGARLHSAVMDTTSELNNTPLLGQRYLVWLEEHEGEAAMFPEKIVDMYLRDLSGADSEHATSDAETIQKARIQVRDEFSASAG